MLQAALDTKLSIAEKMASAYGPVRAGWAASMLRLDAYRQTFESLVHSMTTYKPILDAIKGVYDSAVEDALRVSYENIQMRAALAVSDARLSKAVDAALQVRAAAAPLDFVRCVVRALLRSTSHTAMEPPPAPPQPHNLAGRHGSYLHT